MSENYRYSTTTRIGGKKLNENEANKSVYVLIKYPSGQIRFPLNLCNFTRKQ